MTELSYSTRLEDEGLLLRKIALNCLGMSYGQFKRAKFQGELLLDGQPVHANARVGAGQLLVVRIPDPAAPRPAPYALPLSIAYADSHFLILDKPAPLPCVSSPQKDAPTLENALFTKLGCPDGFLYRPVNRLDKGTSGLMLVALTAHAQQRLQSMLHTDGFVREYLAVCQGHPPELQGRIDLPIAKAEGATVRRVIAQGGKPAATWYELLQTTKNQSLFRLRLETGRTHQIRVHLQALGCPVAGDFLYGKEHPALPGRFALHSHRVSLLHPFTQERLVVESPLPKELAALMEED